jgi:GT2 family glycosyltransferase
MDSMKSGRLTQPLNENCREVAAESETSQLAVSVIIPACNAERDIVRCVRAIQASRGITPEIVLVDDASTDSTVSFATESGVSVVLRSERCCGPAAARNAGAIAASGDVLFFVDADVIVHPDALLQGVSYLKRGPWDAVFGSYDAAPCAPGLSSVYRNLLHHYVHQTSNPEAGTFWSGCGAVRRSKFLQIGGFCTDFQVPSVEDIEFGMRFCENGFRIRLANEIRATHTKHWTLWSMVLTDIFRRGIPWTRLLMARGKLPNDLNICLSQKLSVALTALAELLAAAHLPFYPEISLMLLFVILVVLGTDVLAARNHRCAVPLCALLLAAVVLLAGVEYHVFSMSVGTPLGLLFLLNHRMIRFFIRARGVAFAVCCLPLLLLYYTCCGISFVAGWGQNLWYRKCLTAKATVAPGHPPSLPGVYHVEFRLHERQPGTPVRGPETHSRGHQR